VCLIAAREPIAIKRQVDATHPTGPHPPDRHPKLVVSISRRAVGAFRAKGRDRPRITLLGTRVRLDPGANRNRENLTSAEELLPHFRIHALLIPTDDRDDVVGASSRRPLILKLGVACHPSDKCRIWGPRPRRNTHPPGMHHRIPDGCAPSTAASSRPRTPGPPVLRSFRRQAIASTRSRPLNPRSTAPSRSACAASASADIRSCDAPVAVRRVTSFTEPSDAPSATSSSA